MLNPISGWMAYNTGAVSEYRVFFINHGNQYIGINKYIHFLELKYAAFDDFLVLFFV
jgi:hypothetical protein